MRVQMVGILRRGDSVWVTASGELPTFTTDTPPFWQDVELFNGEMSRIVGAPLTVLRPTAVEPTPDGQVRVYVLAAPSGVPGSWAAAASIPSPVPGTSLSELVAELTQNPLAVPWYRSGWYRTATSWIGQQAAVHPIDSLTQYRVWGLSTLIRVESAQGRFWFKANGPPFADEIVKTVALAERFPHILPCPVSYDLDRGWAIFEDLGSESLNERLHPETWAAAAAAYARMQMDSVALRPELEAAGVPVYSEVHIADEIELMVADDEALTSGEYGLDAADVERVRHRARGWVEAMHALGQLGIPLAIEHGDLHSGQMLIDTVGQVRIIDWSDVAFANPLISLETFVGALHRNLGSHLSSDDLARIGNAFSEAFLAEWGTVVDSDVLRRGIELVQGATAPLEALPFWRMVSKMEQRWEFHNVVPLTLGPDVD